MDESDDIAAQVADRVLNEDEVYYYEYKRLYSQKGVLLYEGMTYNGKACGAGMSFWPDGTIYQEGLFGVKGLLWGSEYYPSGDLRFKGAFHLNGAYGPNFPELGEFYDDSGQLLRKGKPRIWTSGLGYPFIVDPEGFGGAAKGKYGRVAQEGAPRFDWIMWEDKDGMLPFV